MNSRVRARLKKCARFPDPCPNMRTQKWVLLVTLFLGLSNKHRAREIHFAEPVLGPRVATCGSRFGDQIRVYEICNFDGVESSGVHVFHWAQGLLRRIPVSDDWKLCTPQGGGAFAACLQSMCDARAKCDGAAFQTYCERPSDLASKVWHLGRPKSMVLVFGMFWGPKLVSRRMLFEPMCCQ